MSVVDTFLPAVSADSRPVLRARLGSFGFVYNPRTGKIETYRAGRKDLAHLTIAWGTTSGELDIHLAWGHEDAMIGAGDKRYESLVKISPADLEQLGIRVTRLIKDGLEPRLMAVYRKYSPAWLALRRYLIVFVKEEELRAWFGRAAPRIRGKYQLEAEQIVDPANYPAGFADSIYRPSVLHEIREPAAEIPVSAVRIRDGEVVMDETITLRHTLGPDGTVGWWGTKQSDLESVAHWSTTLMTELLLSIFGGDYGAKLERILIGLGVDLQERTQILSKVASDIVGPAISAAPRNSELASRGSIST
ncbi:MAG TPA: hypothetical protein VHJ20_10220 [Polyangia bacterium]|nr:hypothetical protein [Polyangia bacterium]